MIGPQSQFHHFGKKKPIPRIPNPLRTANFQLKAEHSKKPENLVKTAVKQTEEHFHCCVKNHSLKWMQSHNFRNFLHLASRKTDNICQI